MTILKELEHYLWIVVFMSAGDITFRANLDIYFMSMCKATHNLIKSTVKVGSLLMLTNYLSSVTAQIQMYEPLPIFCLQIS